ncbi:DNAJ protein JJJ1 homolog [Salvia splendens]|uniref:DNAJ protein JJJ1 homolog n=1 Tax=Salvia splendens TaxID=180675 RepID=UPI001C272169|nr:DNAJ protein JJJ1 homolog [Salvia splendens]
MASSEKRCLYEVLGLSRDCSADEIRSAYRRLALQRHPDKLVRSGVSEADATAAFQELVNAYEVLSDDRERAWYDSHRNQILFSSTSSSASGGSSGFVPDLFSFFSNSVYSGYSDSGRGFYKVYRDLFEKIYANELNFAKKLGLPLPREAPVMGNLESPYVQVTAFYSYWLGFTTILEFFWADQYDAMAGPNRKSRRLMEEENKKLRKKARREYNETVRGLAEFVKKRDKRVIDMQIKRNEEMERKREEEKQRKKELERQKAEKARNYEEPEWAKVEEVEEEDESEDALEEKKNEFYCVACSKKFRSDKQWKNHEQSKKHKEKVAQLREAFLEEDIECEAEVDADDGSDICYLSADDGVSKLGEQFEAGIGIQEDDSDDGQNESGEAVEFKDPKEFSGRNRVAAGTGPDVEDDDDSDDGDEASVFEAMLSGHTTWNKARNQPSAPAAKTQMESDGDELDFTDYNDTKGEDPKDFSGVNGVVEGMGPDEEDDEDNDDGDEASVFEAMLSGRRSRNKARNQPMAPAAKTQTESDGDELGFMEYNDTKGSRSNRGRRRRRGRRHEDAEPAKPSTAERNGKAEEDEECDGDATELISEPLPESETTRTEDAVREKVHKHQEQGASKKLPAKKENAAKSKASSKGRKQKVSTRGADNMCEKCGEEFESKNKLHKHLGETGHASLKR